MTTGNVSPLSRPSPGNIHHQAVPFWRDVRVLAILSQIAFVVVVAVIAGLLYANLTTALVTRGLSSDFGFLDDEAGFEIKEGISYTPADTYGRAFLVGLFNTLRVAVLGIFLATLLGVVMGVARLSSNWLVAQIASAYIEVMRNTPLLVQLVFWYFAVVLQLPLVNQSLQLPGPIFINRRGVFVPGPLTTPSTATWLIFVGIALVVAVAVWALRRRWQERTGRPGYPWALGILALGAIATAGWFLAGESPLVVEAPSLQGFNFRGGLRLTPEFFALLLGLVVYTGAFIAEVVRGGILAVSKGQTEAAKALGLGTMLTLRLVIFPQAVRIIIPPLISQYLNLAKNSSLAIAIGFPDLFFVGQTMQNQTGRPIPVYVLIMASYLIMSLVTSTLMNIYNRRMQFVLR
jgi:general L-amino acid transport system permease protein